MEPPNTLPSASSSESAFLLKEYEALRSEINDRLKELWALEKFALGGAAAITAWLFTQDKLHFGAAPWWLPFIFLSLCAWRFAAGMYHLAYRKSKYIKERIERRFLPSNGGWEVWFTQQSLNETIAYTVLWLVSICLSLSLPLYFQKGNSWQSKHEGLMYKLDTDLIRAVAPVVALFIAAILGYIIYNRQEKIKSCRQRYLNEGIDVLTDSIETILRTFMHNWATALNALRVFHQIGPRVDIDEYTKKFQYPQVDFQIKANDRLKVLLGNLNFYTVHQQLLALHIKSIDFFSTYLMTGLTSFAKSDDKVRGEVMATYLPRLEELKKEADSYYKLLDFLYELTRLLEKSHYDFETIEEFPSKYEVRDIVNKLEQAYPQYFQE